MWIIKIWLFLILQPQESKLAKTAASPSITENCDTLTFRWPPTQYALAGEAFTFHFDLEEYLGYVSTDEVIMRDKPNWVSYEVSDNRHALVVKGVMPEDITSQIYLMSLVGRCGNNTIGTPIRIGSQPQVVEQKKPTIPHYLYIPACAIGSIIIGSCLACYAGYIWTSCR